MPWDIKRNYGGCKGYAVVKENGEVVGCHKTRNAAIGQQRALYASEAQEKSNRVKELWKNSVFARKNNNLPE